MRQLKSALESLDEDISVLEDRIGLDSDARREQRKRQEETLKAAKAREASVMAVAQRVASRLDWTISRVERILEKEE